MRKQHVAALAIALLLTSAAAASAQQPAQEPAQQPQGPALEVAEAVISTGVEDRQPVDNMTSFAADVGRVYCWTRIVGAEGETQIEHVWYKADEEMARVSLTIGGSNWRTWSSKNIEPSWTGDWRVDIVGPDGTVLDSVTFTIG